MTLPASGTISISQIETEIQRTSSTQISLGETDSRELAGVLTGAIRFSDFYGKAGVVANSITFVGAGTYTFTKPKYFNTLGVLVWGGGGSSGSFYSGGTVAGGGTGGYFYHANTSVKSAVNSTETVIVGAGGIGGGYAGNPGTYSSFGGFLFARGGHSGGGSYATRIDSVDVTTSLRTNWVNVTSETGGAGGGQSENTGSGYGSWDGMNTTYAGGGGCQVMNDPYHGGRPYTSDFYGGKASALASGSSFYTSPPSSNSIVALTSSFLALAAGGYGQVNSLRNGGGPTTDPEFRYGKFPGGGGGGADGVTGGGTTSPGSDGAVHIYWY